MRLQLSISTRIFLGFLTLLIAFGAVNLWSIYQLRQIGLHLRLLRPVYRLNTRISQLEALQLNKRNDAARFLTSQAATLQVEWLERLAFAPAVTSKLDSSIKLVEQLAIRTQERDADFIQKLNLFFRRIQYFIEQRHLVLSKTQAALSSLSEAALQKLQKRFQQMDDGLRNEIQQLSKHMDFRPLQAVLDAEREERRAVLGLILSSFAALLVGLLTLLWSMVPLRRIRYLTAMTRRISEGDYIQEVQIPSGDEIGRLAQDFNRMARSLHERDLHLARQREALEEAYRDLQQSSDRLLRSERLAAIGRLAAQITHEVRNPLNAIGLNLELLEEDIQQIPEPDEALAVLHSTTREVERLTSITEEYLQFARLPPPQLEEANIGALLKDIMDFLNTEMASRKIDWAWSEPPSYAMINFDQRQMRQALLNLIRNATEAAASGPAARPRIEVGLHHTTDGVEIYIDDNGPGIPPETQEKIFDPFFSTKEGGSGLGLPLTQQIIHGHGGILRSENQHPHGTRFIIELPR
ncbi:MAG: HAMP domain-containing protein [Myxococcales bacterium]|nr:HAMP domain-containing protein [Myxococcales bacterium]MCB9642992.1 HAMP domain-containing protein [Myxococcales bacterium]